MRNQLASLRRSSLPPLAALALLAGLAPATRRAQESPTQAVYRTPYPVPGPARAGGGGRGH